MLQVQRYFFFQLNPDPEHSKGQAGLRFHLTARESTVCTQAKATQLATDMSVGSPTNLTELRRICRQIIHHVASCICFQPADSRVAPHKEWKKLFLQSASAPVFLSVGFEKTKNKTPKMLPHMIGHTTHPFVPWFLVISVCSDARHLSMCKESESF